uniref:MADS-box domain-containing protein n=1 Tax=Trichobilharzia regenti TaxID=157069 RepID=A0AA85J6E0_TRIRE|nr:unnamed protein product [Trichobilharzia regenti]
MGRRKIEVRKIEDKNKCVATFRKRRDGLFKKALELHRLTGAEIMLTLVYNKSKYCFNSHGNSEQGSSNSNSGSNNNNSSSSGSNSNVPNTFHYTKHFQFKACGSHLPQGCSESNCPSKLNNNNNNNNNNSNNNNSSSRTNQRNTPPFDTVFSSSTCSNIDKLNSLPMIDSMNNYTKAKYKGVKLTNEERMANLRYLIVDELFKRALARFRSLSKVSSLTKKESLISPVYSNTSWTMLSPSSIIPTRKISSASQLVNSPDKVLHEHNNTSSTSRAMQMHTDSLLLDEPSQSLQLVYASNDFPYSPNTDCLQKEFNSSPLSQILEFIDENVYNNAITATPVTPTADAITIPPAAAANTTTNNDDDNEREYLDLDEVQQSRYTGLQTPNIICYLDESINYYPISGSSSSQPVDEINAHPGDQRTTHRHNDSDLVIEELL